MTVRRLHERSLRIPHGTETYGRVRVLRDACSTDEEGTLCILYRAATDDTHRNMILLVSWDHGEHFVASRVAKWELNACPMSTDFFSRTRSGVLIAWQTAGQVFYARVARAGTRSQKSWQRRALEATENIQWSLATRAVKRCWPGQTALRGSVVEQWRGSSLTKRDALLVREAASRARPFGTWSGHR